MTIKIGKMALRTPSTNAHQVTPTMLLPCNASGTMSNAGAAKIASRHVTINVIRALFQPGILKPSIRVKSNKIGIMETNAAMENIN